jgi:adenylate kinase family enzyme
MTRGIIIFGAPGAGDTTLGKELAKLFGFQHFDLDDYWWDWDTKIPFTVFRPRKERIELLMDAISKYPYFVMSGSMYSIRESFASLFDLAVFITAPTAVRMERIQMRELSRFGERILAGGDMCEGHLKFLQQAKHYDAGEPQCCLKQHEQWISELNCPVLRVDGTKQISKNVTYIAEKFFSIKQTNSNP